MDTCMHGLLRKEEIEVYYLVIRLCPPCPMIELFLIMLIFLAMYEIIRSVTLKLLLLISCK